MQLWFWYGIVWRWHNTSSWLPTDQKRNRIASIYYVLNLIVLSSSPLPIFQDSTVFFFFFFSNWFIAYECLVSNMFRWMSVLCLISYLPVPAPKLCYHSTDVILVRPILFWHIVCIHVCKLGVCVFAGILCYFVEKCLLTKSIGNYLIDIIHVFAFASLSLPSVHLFAYKLEHRVCTLLFSHIFFLVFHWFIYFSEVFFSNSDFGSIHSIYREPTRFFPLILIVLYAYLLIFLLSLKNSVWFMGF